MRLALDGFDQLSDTAAADIADLIDRLRDLPQDAADVRLVVSSRPGAAPPDADTEVGVDAATDPAIRAYLHAQQIPASLLGAITQGSSGSWLVASLLADHARATPDLGPGDVPRGLAAVYEQIFGRGLDGGARWEQDDCAERALFTVLAEVGPGAVLPAPLLLNACARLGIPHVTQTWLRTALPAPHLFGDRLKEFKAAVKHRLTDFSDNDTFPEDNEFLIRLGRRGRELLLTERSGRTEG